MSSPKKIYLDSSAIVKRYISEKGSDVVNLVYSKCDLKDLSICLSFWNIGEALGAFDQYRQRKWITQKQHDAVVTAFSGECLRLLMLDALITVPVNSSILSNTWEIIERHHIYQGDAIQIVSFEESGSDLFLSADGSLLDVAERENIPAANIEDSTDAVKLKISG